MSDSEAYDPQLTLSSLFEGMDPGSIRSFEDPETAQEVIQAIVALVASYGPIDGAHHKDWVLDQIVRLALQDSYHSFVEKICAGEDGPDTYSWEEGIAP